MRPDAPAKELTLEQHMALRAKLVAFAKEYSTTRPNSDWPRVRDLARRFKVRQSDILSACEDEECLDLVVGVQIPGSGYASEDKEGDYRIEWYDPNPEPSMSMGGP